MRIGQVYTNSNSGRTQETARRHPRGRAKVYYAPDSPQKSVLEPGIHGDVFLIPGVGLLFAIVGGIIMVQARKQRSLFSRD